MFRVARLFIRELFNGTQRFRFLFHLFRNFPGETGYLIRQHLLRRHLKEMGKGVAIAPGFKFWNIDGISLGNHVRLADDDYIQGGGGVTIGDHTILGPCVKIWSQNHSFSDPDTPILEQGYGYAPVTIGKHCWIGANAFIMPGVELGDGCIV
ncbi:MAG TPA: acyltransferase, partial [candidate division Zixibacteria bacterium]|nr:acyltransferase [candidate division Zixibacteria bacterium]